MLSASLFRKVHLRPARNHITSLVCERQFREAWCRGPGGARAVAVHRDLLLSLVGQRAWARLHGAPRPRMGRRPRLGVVPGRVGCTWVILASMLPRLGMGRSQMRDSIQRRLLKSSARQAAWRAADVSHRACCNVTLDAITARKRAATGVRLLHQRWHLPRRGPLCPRLQQ